MWCAWVIGDGPSAGPTQPLTRACHPAGWPDRQRSATSFASWILTHPAALWLICQWNLGGDTRNALGSSSSGSHGNWRTTRRCWRRSNDANQREGKGPPGGLKVSLSLRSRRRAMLHPAESRRAGFPVFHRLGGHLKTGQSWKGRNRPVSEAPSTSVVPRAISGWWTGAAGTAVSSPMEHGACSQSGGRPARALCAHRADRGARCRAERPRGPRRSPWQPDQPSSENRSRCQFFMRGGSRPWPYDRRRSWTSTVSRSSGRPICLPSYGNASPSCWPTCCGRSSQTARSKGADRLDWEGLRGSGQDGLADGVDLPVCKGTCVARPGTFSSVRR
jgi:hypothetical protein